VTTLERLLDKTVYSSKGRIVYLSGVLSSQIYVWQRKIRDRKQRKPQIYAEEVDAALENIESYPHMGGKKGAAMLTYHQLEYIGQRCYDWLKYRFKQILFTEIQRRDLLRPKSKWVKDIAQYFGEIWCADFTHVFIMGYTIYIAVVLDDFSHFYLGYNVSLWEDVALVDGAFQMALQCCRGVLPERYMVNDRGSQYKAKLYRNQVEKYGIEQMFVPRRSPWYNGEAEVGMKDIQALFYRRLSPITIDKDLDIVIYAKEIADEIFKELNERIPRLKLKGVTPKDIVTQQAETKRSQIKAFVQERISDRKNKIPIDNIDHHMINKLNIEKWDDKYLKNMFHLLNYQYHKIKPN